MLTLKAKAAWYRGKVAVALFLDIKGTFPNTVPEKLVNNLRKRGVPMKYTNFIESMLKDRNTVLKFNGFILENITINNGIG